MRRFWKTGAARAEGGGDWGVRAGLSLRLFAEVAAAGGVFESAGDGAAAGGAGDAAYPRGACGRAWRS